MRKETKLVLVIGFILFLALTIYYIFQANSVSETHAITGKIIHITDNALTVESIDLNLYVVNTKTNNYSLGQVIEVYTKSPILETYPAQIKASRIIIIEKHTEEATLTIIYAKTDIPKNTKITESLTEAKTIKYSELGDMTSYYLSIENIIGKYAISDIKKDEYFKINNLTDILPNTNNKKEENNTQITSPNEPVKTEADVINYFTNLEASLNNSTTSSSSIKEHFVTIIDFLFYNGTIYDKTFNELSDQAKIQILKASLYIDSKIDTLFPGYKDTIGNTANNIKIKIITTYLDTTTKICLENQIICAQAKSDFQDMKNSFSLTWQFLSELAGSSIQKISDWYLIWR